jgi:hypothetical protein
MKISFSAAIQILQFDSVNRIPNLVRLLIIRIKLILNSLYLNFHTMFLILCSVTKPHSAAPVPVSNQFLTGQRSKMSKNLERVYINLFPLLVGAKLFEKGLENFLKYLCDYQKGRSRSYRIK